jgi:hypothetical protein
MPHDRPGHFKEELPIWDSLSVRSRDEMAQAPDFGAES